MKRWQILLVVPGFVSLLVACNSSGTVAPPQSPVANGSPVFGTISNWIPGKTATLYAQVFSSTPSTSVGVTVAADGSFSNLVLPTPTDAELNGGGNLLGSCSGGSITATPSDGKAVFALLTTKPNSGSDVYQANAVESSSSAFDPGSNGTYRIFVTKNTILSGSCTTTTGTPKYTYTYDNVSFVQGWNILNISLAGHDLSATTPIVETFTSGAVSSDQKFFLVLPETANIAQVRSDTAKKLLLKWDAVPEATGYSLQIRSAGLDLGNGVGQYGPAIDTTATTATVPANPSTSYDVRVRTRFGANLSYGAEGIFLSTATLNPDGLNILFSTQGVPNPVSIAKGASQTVALEFERGANCAAALNLSISGSSTVGSAGPAPVGAASSGTVSGSFAPNSTVGNSSLLNLAVGSGVSSGTYTVDVNADGCPTGVSTILLLTVP